MEIKIVKAESEEGEAVGLGGQQWMGIKCWWIAICVATIAILRMYVCQLAPTSGCQTEVKDFRT